MNFNFKIHHFKHLVKSTLGHVFFFFEKFKKKNDLLVLNYHGTQTIFLKSFKQQLSFLQQHGYHFISPDDFESIISSNTPIDGKFVLITFDDGIKNNLNILPILSEFDISAYFFIVPKFINTTTEEQKNYFLKYIRPIVNPKIDFQEEDFQALSWQDIKKITSLGHKIGSHTASHTMTAKNTDHNFLYEEIVNSKHQIENTLGLKISSFCSINNTSLSVNPPAKKLIKENYTFHYTTFGGNNSNRNPYLIERLNAEAYWLKGAFKFILTNKEQKRWAQKIKDYNSPQ